MNIFVLDEDPEIAAQDVCDKHVPKMVLETAQLLCSSFYFGPRYLSCVPYKLTHSTHPCAIWTRKSAGNYLWLLDHGLALAAQYTRRFNKQHKSLDVIMWCKEHMMYLEDVFSHTKGGLTPFAQAMPEKYKQPNAVLAYQSYYKNEKNRFAKWEKLGIVPTWWKND